LVVLGALVTRNGMGGTSSDRLGPVSTGVVVVVPEVVAGEVAPVVVGAGGVVPLTGVVGSVVEGSVVVVVRVLVGAVGVVGRLTFGSTTSPVWVPKYQTAINASTSAPRPPYTAGRGRLESENPVGLLILAPPLRWMFQLIRSGRAGFLRQPGCCPGSGCRTHM
jgi:hypothetical protein